MFIAYSVVVSDSLLDRCDTPASSSTTYAIEFTLHLPYAVHNTT